jgi:hypothetical protein
MKHREALRGFATACSLMALSCEGNPAPPDPGPVDYSRVQAIFSSRCGGGACHIGTGDPQLLGGALDLSPAQAGPCTINVSAQQDPMRMRVVPGQPDMSYLLCKVDPSCSSLVGSRMPIGAPLSSDDVALLRAWIQQGATGGASGTCATSPGGGPDTTAPTFAGATGATSAPSSITVQWSGATDNVTQPDQIVYLIYQATAAGAQSFAAPSFTTAPGATSYSIGKLPINTRYYYVVRARDQAGNIDPNKIEVSATTPATSDMQAPTFAGLNTASASGLSITLSWSAATDTVSQPAQITYLVYQATSAGSQSFTMPSYTTAAGATSYTVTGLAPNTTYYFVVRAQDAAGNTDMNRIERSARTANVTFSGQVQPIFTRDCTSGACHGARNPAQALDLSSAAASYMNLVNVASTQCSMTKRVLPMQPDMSYLMWKLQGSGPCFSGSQMPKGQPLSAADQAAIRGWILAGAPNN